VRLRRFALARGWLDTTVEYFIAPGIGVAVPLWKRPYTLSSVLHYERDVIDRLSQLQAELGGPCTFIDCGADIGLMSVKAVAALPEIKYVYAFEPNSQIFPWLERNMSSLPIPATAVPAAVADFSGRGTLERPAHDPQSEHAAFLVPNPEGPIIVQRIDDLELRHERRFLIKIDVEGNELSVIRGATATLQRAERFAIVFEGHRDQVYRSGIDPSDVTRYIREIRPVTTSIIEEPNRHIDWERPFFQQVTGRIYNIAVLSE
jgi:FkbM family methyltransferase